MTNSNKIPKTIEVPAIGTRELYTESLNAAVVNKNSNEVLAVFIYFLDASKFVNRLNSPEAYAILDLETGEELLN